MKKTLLALTASLMASGLMANEEVLEEAKIVEPVELQEKSTNTLSNPLIYDRYFSPHASSADLITVHRALQSVGDSTFPYEHSDDSVVSAFGRYLSLALIWTPVNFVTTAGQYGLGANAKAEELKISHQDVKDFFRTGSYESVKKARLVGFATLDAGRIMQNRLAMDWVEKKAIDARESTLYSIPAFINMSAAFNFGLIEEVHGFNQLYKDQNVSNHRIRKWAYLNLLDPVDWFASYSSLYYIVTGKPLELPMIPVGEMGWLPAMGLDLTPSGPEIVSRHYFRMADGSPVMLVGRFGRLEHRDHWGLGLEAPKVFAWGNNSAGFKLDVFEQISENDKKFLGGAFSVINSNEIGETGVNLYTQLGYKTRGYLAGEPDKEGLIARGGMAFNF